MKRVEVRLKEVLTERNIEQKQLAEMTGLTERTISELCTNKVKRVPKDAIERIVMALEISDINDIITLVNEEDSDK